MLIVYYLNRSRCEFIPIGKSVHVHIYVLATIIYYHSYMHNTIPNCTVSV
jgi:hypothetical protein